MTQASDATPVGIEPAKQADIDDLLYLEEICFVDYYEPHRFGPAEFTDYISSERKVIYVARSGGRLAGYVAGAIGQSGDKPAASMDSLAVRPQRQRAIRVDSSVLSFLSLRFRPRRLEAL